MTPEQFSAEIGKVFQTEWRRARRKALAMAFTTGMVTGFLFGYFNAELSHLRGGGGEKVTDRAETGLDLKELVGLHVAEQ